MTRFRLWATNIATAIIVAFVTSLFWIIAYSNAGDDRDVEPARDTATVETEGAGKVEIAEGLVVGPTGLAIPVAGVKASQLIDTYTQARAGGARVHDAIDIMAERGTPVVAAAPGTVEKLFFSDGGGGITAYIRSEDKRWTYYYAHLHDYAPGLREGQHVRRGTPIGRVGSTGNANPEGPHLHFAIHRMEPGEGWWEGSAINPYPLLAGRE